VLQAICDHGSDISDLSDDDERDDDFNLDDASVQSTKMKALCLQLQKLMIVMMSHLAVLLIRLLLDGNRRGPSIRLLPISLRLMMSVTEAIGHQLIT